MCGLFAKSLFLAFLTCFSCSEAKDSYSRNQTEFFTGLVESLSSAERNGRPDVGWRPIDPFKLTYGYSFILNSPFSFKDYVEIWLSGSLSGFSNYDASDVRVVESDAEVSIAFTATTGPIAMEANFILSGWINETNTPLYDGTLNFTADGTTRTLIFDLDVLPDGSTYVQWSHSWDIRRVTRFSLQVTDDLSAEIKNIVNAQKPSDVIHGLTWQYMNTVEDLLTDLANYPPKAPK